MSDPFDLNRFVEAQDPVLAQVQDELRSGRKRSHWMWFVFPQLAGLGSSPMARRYAIRSLAEARAYLDHATLGPRLIKCTELALAIKDATAHEIFGSPDDMKFRSCLTLFGQLRPAPPCFDRALKRFYGGEADSATLRLLG